MNVGKTGMKALSIVSRAFVYCWGLFTIFTFLWILTSALKTNNEFFSKAWGLFKTPQFSNFTKILFNYKLERGFINSIFVVIVAIVGVLVVSTPAAYVLARIIFPFRRSLSKFITFGMGIPVQFLLIPLYFIIFRMKLIDNLWGLILVYISLSIPFTIFLMTGFFKSLPGALEEAARIDGCSKIRTFFKIMLPLGQPAIVTATVFLFLDLINEFLFAFTLIGSDTKYTMSVQIYSLQGSMQYTGDWVALFAGIVIIIIPSAIIYLFLSRQLIQGITMGAVKE